VSFLHDFQKRIEGISRKPVMLYFGDFDPSGVEMLEAMQITINEELNFPDIIFKRIALLEGDIYEYNLPHDPTALKWTDTRARKYVNKYGELAVEIDALSPQVLEDKIRNAIINELDISLFREQQKIYKDEKLKLTELKDQFLDLLEEE
jgi:hypothetical protein